MVKIQRAESAPTSSAVAVLLAGTDDNYLDNVSAAHKAVLARFREAKRNTVPFYGSQDEPVIYYHNYEPKAEEYQTAEMLRKAGASLASELRSLKIKDVVLKGGKEGHQLHFAEGMALSSYQFAKYRKDQPDNALQSIYITDSKISDEDITEMQCVISGTWLARDLVNEPLSTLTAEELGEQVKRFGKEAGFKTEVLNKAKIEALKMGGLLSVSMGSIDPPTFSIMEYKPKGAVNKKPVVLVGKGVVFDTGGLTLKPTPGSMDLMKSDMAGAAAVLGAMYAIATAKLPVYIIALIPATENRPGERAIVPGDVIRAMDGTTIEVLNTDAEGRLILADALVYARKYEPELVIDLATLTGAAARAIGPQGIVYMGTADADSKAALTESGLRTYERLVEMPLWDEYGEMIKSDIADLKNVASGASAGAITAGKFLQHFTDYPWLHLDIAGPAFLSSPDSYRGKNGSGVGVRLLFDFVKHNYRK